MSHDRSFPYMTVDELAVKKAFDTYRLSTLQSGVIEPLRKWGFSGIDESLYALRYKVTGSAQTKIGYFRDQIRQTDEQLQSRDEKPADSCELILGVDANPATFWTLRRERAALRRMRMSRMADDGVRLNPREQFLRAEYGVESLVTRVLGNFGGLGEFLQEQKFMVLGSALLVGALYTGNNWLSASRIYNDAAQDYVESSIVGEHALPLKRDVPSQAGQAAFFLTYTPEITIPIGDDDDELTIPSKPSLPSAGRLNALTMEKIVSTHLQPDVLQHLPLTPVERTQLTRIGTMSAAAAGHVADTLLFETRTDVTYGAQIAQLYVVSAQVQHAVEVLETHMDADVVDEENRTHDDMSFWKWCMYATGGLSGLFFYNAYRKAQRGRYYGY